jgi:myo-inositol 2-dehydrogenase/D-chiro-inositol 1-dehydrogenase
MAGEAAFCPVIRAVNRSVDAQPRLGGDAVSAVPARASEPVAVAVAGLGAIGLLHARHLAQQVCGAHLTSVVDQDRALAEATGGELGVAWSTSYREAVEGPAVAAVVIATPSPLHAGMVEQAAGAGKHVFCEKPLSLDGESGRRASAAASAAGIRLQVGFQRRFDPDFMEAKRRIDAGEVGHPLLLRLSHRNRVPPHAGALAGRLGGPLIDMMIHDFDTALWLVGAVTGVRAFATPSATVVVARFENGALGVIDNTRRAGYGFECTAELIGTRSTLRIGWARRAGALQQLTPSGLLARLPADHIQCHRAAYLDEIRHFIACVRSGTEPAVGGADSIAALALSLAAERCLA